MKPVIVENVWKNIDICCGKRVENHVIKMCTEHGLSTPITHTNKRSVDKFYLSTFYQQGVAPKKAFSEGVLKGFPHVRPDNSSNRLYI